jgi:hypothetical protein
MTNWEYFASLDGWVAQIDSGLSNYHDDTRTPIRHNNHCSPGSHGRRMLLFDGRNRGPHDGLLLRTFMSSEKLEWLEPDNPQFNEAFKASFSTTTRE